MCRVEWRGGGVGPEEREKGGVFKTAQDFHPIMSQCSTQQAVVTAQDFYPIISLIEKMISQVCFGKLAEMQKHTSDPISRLFSALKCYFLVYLLPVKEVSCILELYAAFP